MKRGSPRVAEERIDGLKEPGLLTTRGVITLAGEILHWKRFLWRAIRLHRAHSPTSVFDPKRTLSQCLNCAHCGPKGPLDADNASISVTASWDAGR